MVKVRLYYFNALRPDNADHCDCRGRYSDQSRQKKLRHSQTRLPCAWLPLQEFYRISMGCSIARKWNNQLSPETSLHGPHHHGTTFT
ncbi:hypothetical protein F2P79_002139 [Pimephales promelas]|nr:hypothetical protein F2P79_002139 [Pimephales promelas]